MQHIRWKSKVLFRMLKLGSLSYGNDATRKKVLDTRMTYVEQFCFYFWSGLFFFVTMQALKSTFIQKYCLLVCPHMVGEEKMICYFSILQNQGNKGKKKKKYANALEILKQIS